MAAAAQDFILNIQIEIERLKEEMKEREKRRSWKVNPNLSLFVKPEARCPFCGGGFKTKHIWLVSETYKCVNGVWDEKGKKAEIYGSHPHIERDFRLCYGDAKSAAQLMWMGIDGERTHQVNADVWFWQECGHACEKAPKNRCIRCLGNEFHKRDFVVDLGDSPASVCPDCDKKRLACESEEEKCERRYGRASGDIRPRRCKVHLTREFFYCVHCIQWLSREEEKEHECPGLRAEREAERLAQEAEEVRTCDECDAELTEDESVWCEEHQPVCGDCGEWLERRDRDYCERHSNRCIDCGRWTGRGREEDDYCENCEPEEEEEEEEEEYESIPEMGLCIECGAELTEEDNSLDFCLNHNPDIF